jgi:hypothetical protein
MEGHMGSNHTQEINKYLFFTKVFIIQTAISETGEIPMCSKKLSKSIILNNNIKLNITQIQSF